VCVVCGSGRDTGNKKFAIRLQSTIINDELLRNQFLQELQGKRAECVHCTFVYISTISCAYSTTKSQTEMFCNARAKWKYV
jgi:hypothetical protein